MRPVTEVFDLLQTYRVTEVEELQVPMQLAVPVPVGKNMFGRNFYFTTYGVESLSMRLEGTAVRYVAWQVEECAATGRRHVQGYAEFKGPIFSEAVRKLLGRAGHRTYFGTRNKGRVATRYAARAFTTRQESRANVENAGPWGWGEWNEINERRFYGWTDNKPLGTEEQCGRIQKLLIRDERREWLETNDAVLTRCLKIIGDAIEAEGHLEETDMVATVLGVVDTVTKGQVARK